MRTAIILTLLLAAVPGCKKTKGPSSASGTESTVSASPASAAPAKTDDGGGRNWTQAEIEEVLRKDVKLTQMTLKKEADDKYTGTGQNAEGVPFTFVVRFRPGEIRVDYSRETPRGGTNHGKYHWSAEGVTKKF